MTKFVDVTPFRFRLSFKRPDGVVNKSYLIRDGRGRVYYKSGDEQMLQLSDLFGDDTAEMRFTLEDAFSSDTAIKFLKKALEKHFPSPEVRPAIEVI